MEGPTAMLRQYVAMDFLAARYHMVTQALSPETTADWDGHLLTRALQTKGKHKLSLAQKRALLTFIDRTMLTSARAHKQGFSVNNRCQCGHTPDDWAHWQTGCQHRQEMANLLSMHTKLAEAWSDIAETNQPSATNDNHLHEANLWPPTFTLPPLENTVPIFKVNGITVHPHDFPMFRTNEYTYGDGSRYEGHWPNLRRSGMALYQPASISGPALSIQRATPACLPQTAAIGEHLATQTLALYTEGPADPVVDCASIITAFRSSPAERFHHSRPLAGIWRELPIANIPSVTKVKAHLSLHHINKEDRQAVAHFHGNQEVDQLAKKAVNRIADHILNPLLSAYKNTLLFYHGIAKAIHEAKPWAYQGLRAFKPKARPRADRRHSQAKAKHPHKWLVLHQLSPHKETLHRQSRLLAVHQQTSHLHQLSAERHPPSCCSQSSVPTR